ncbi:MAG: fructosamine kinase family protein [Magnetospirillum sp. WYHS-4]
MSDLRTAIGEAVGVRPLKLTPLSGGCVGDVYRVELEDGRRLVAKAGDAGSGLGIEGYMLSYLAAHSRLPVPQVLHADDGLLLMTWIETSGSLDDSAESHAAELLADLHGIAAPRFGLDRDTLIGGLPQPNPWTGSWVEFFRDRRLLHMGHRAGLPARTLARLETFCARLGTWIAEPAAPALLHGDMWGGNVLCRKGRIAGFIDPAIYYGDPEIELAFSTLFGTFGEAFFRRYGELRPLRPGFFEERRDIYNLYPLLVHVRLFGGSYLGSVERILSRFGC